MADDEARMNELIRAVRTQRGDEEMTLPDAVVHAYLVGQASAKEKAAVRHALARSPELRRELVELAQYLENLSSRDAAVGFDAATAPMVPAQILRQGGQTSDAGTERSASFAERIVATFRWLVETPRVFATVPAAAALVVVLSVVPRLSWLPSAPRMTTQLVASRSFVGATGTTRGAGTHDAAAEDRVRHCIRWEGERLTLTTHPPVLELPRRIATVHLVNAWRRRLRTVELVGIEPSAGGVVENAKTNVRVWLALLPMVEGGDVELRAYSLQETTAAIRWEAESRTRGAVFATYEASPGLFESTQCVPVDLDAR